MSRVAKNPVKITSDITVAFDRNNLSVKGGKGSLTLELHNSVSVSQHEDELRFEPKNSDKISRAMAGTTRALVNNMVLGVSKGFEKRLQLIGVGYKAQSKGKVLSLSLGYSHSIEYALPEGISIETPTQTEVLVKGINKQLVGQVAAEIRDFRRPEPYKGKGVRYADEVVLRKEAKKK